MTDTHYSLANVIELSENESLTFPRAKALLNSIEQHRDFTCLQLLRSPVEGDITTEIIVVNVECDEVPSKNRHGIKFRERLALCIPKDERTLVEVLALRIDFPFSMHQNQGRPNTPASLCLYFEPVISVLRSWTPPSFLNRIQWWLEKTAKDELHPADQPVEHLFFASKFELVLPWNIESLRDEGKSLTMSRRESRSDDGFTCFLQEQPQHDSSGRPLTYIELQLPPVVHGTVERDPYTLGELADILLRRNINLLTELTKGLQDSVDEKGAKLDNQDKATVILLRVPMRRSVDEIPEKHTYRAFLMLKPALLLGEAIHALVKHDNVYYRDMMSHAQNDLAWRDIPLLTMEVLQQNTPEAARIQSGLTNEGPSGVLIGAGALGSALVNLWGRSGWGKWTIVDKDHIRPHNISRHTAHNQHIGVPKAIVAAYLHFTSMDNASTFTPIVCDAMDSSHSVMMDALKHADVVIDASTTLEYPRLASSNDDLPRHISVFICPNGTGSVLLAEDGQRKFRLRTLEAQYYRALIQNDWGKEHLSGNLGYFWSGASCRDISVVMPYARVLGHSCNLAEQIQEVSTRDDAVIRIWHKHNESGAVEVFNVQPLSERSIKFDNLELFIDAGVEEDLKGMRENGLPNETGGVLLGYYDFNIGAVFVVAALPPPPDSTASPCHFQRGIEQLKEKVKEVSEITAEVVGYIGEWHSHPPGSTAAPSSADLTQLLYLSSKMAEDGLPALSLIVSEDDLQIYKGSNVDR
jgi:integrative and conjugative element protein (TIGR02256 family)